MLACCLVSLGETSIGDAMQPQLAGVPGEIFTDGKYLKVMLITPAFLVLDAVALLAWSALKPSPLDIARRRYRRGELVAGSSAGAAPPLQSGKAKVEAEKDPPGNGK